MAHELPTCSGPLHAIYLLAPLILTCIQQQTNNIVGVYFPCVFLFLSKGDQVTIRLQFYKRTPLVLPFEKRDLKLCVRSYKQLCIGTRKVYCKTVLFCFTFPTLLFPIVVPLEIFFLILYRPFFTGLTILTDNPVCSSRHKKIFPTCCHQLFSFYVPLKLQ